VGHIEVIFDASEAGWKGLEPGADVFLQKLSDRYLLTFGLCLIIAAEFKYL